MNVVAAAVSLVREYVSPMLDASGILDRRLRSMLDHGNRLLIVMYHRVIDDASLDPFGLGMCVKRQNFEGQLEWFTSQFKPIALDEAVRTLASGGTVPPRSVAITFDDGYLDNLEVAAPLLQQRGLPASFFVPTGGLDEGRALWWDRAIAALSRTRLDEVSIPELGLPRALPLDDSRRRQTARTVLEALWQMPPGELHAMLGALVGRLVPGGMSDLAADCGAPRMNPGQVAELHAMGFNIGAHTVDHLDMRQLDAGRTRCEIERSRDRLALICNRQIRGFAYPSGYHSHALQDQLMRAGFDHAVSTDRGVNSAQLRRFALCRVGMPDTHLGDLKRALSMVPVVGSVSPEPMPANGHAGA